jgi:predicted negative regulator of RcsB-dependent stress response
LARVQLAQGNADAALASIQGAEAGAFAARFAEIRGDALFLKGDKVAALAAWREAEALASDPNVIPTVDVDGIRLKIADTMTDETPAAAAATSAEQAS